jgi:hypothetical protein
MRPEPDGHGDESVTLKQYLQVFFFERHAQSVTLFFFLFFERPAQVRDALERAAQKQFMFVFCVMLKNYLFFLFGVTLEAVP